MIIARDSTWKLLIFIIYLFVLISDAQHVDLISYRGRYGYGTVGTLPYRYLPIYCDPSTPLQGGPAMNDKQYLNTVRKLLRRHCGRSVHPNIELIPAKVPILKFKEQGRDGLEVDLCVNNPTSIRNTHLLFYYCKCDARKQDENSMSFVYPLGVDFGRYPPYL